MNKSHPQALYALRRVTRVTALVILFAIALGFMLPNDYKVERSVSIEAPQDQVKQAILSEESLAKWMYVQDGQLVATKSSLQAGSQMVIAYQGSDQQGLLSVQAIDEQSMVFTVQPKPDVQPVMNHILFLSGEGDTQVRWIIEGQLSVGLLSPYVALFANDIAGRNFEISLQRLKELLEGE